MKHVLPRFCSPAPRPTVAEAEEPPPFACGWPLAACCLPLLWECVLCAHAGRGPVRRAAEATGRGEAPGREKYELPIATMARAARRQSRTRAKVRFVFASNLGTSTLRERSVSLSPPVQPINNRTRSPRQLPQTHDCTWLTQHETAARQQRAARRSGANTARPKVQSTRRARPPTEARRAALGVAARPRARPR